MTYNLQNKINADINLKKFLRENSYWYKILNRNENAFIDFVNDLFVISTSYNFNFVYKLLYQIASFLQSDI